MHGLKRARGVAVLAATLLFSGCASAFGGYDLAPNGLTREDAAIRDGLAEEPVATHEAVLAGERRLPDDDLLRLLYAGTTGRYAGRYRESTQLLDLASYLAEDRVTVSVSEQAMSFITSDRALAYVPNRTERLMVHYIAALSFLEAGDRGGAVVEARRIEALLDRFDEDVDPSDPPYDSRFLHYFAGTVFEAGDEYGSADVAYRRAGSDPPPISEVYEGTPPDSMGEIVVVVERGFVPHRVEQSVAIALPPHRVSALTDGSVAEKAAAAAAAAATILLFASDTYGERGPYYTDRGYQRPLYLSPWRDDCGRLGQPACGKDDSDPYLMRVSWPVLYQDDRVPDDRVSVQVDGLQIGSYRRLDVGRGVRRDFTDGLSTILARTVFRAATKMVLSEAAEDVVSKEDETAGKIVGALVNLGTLLTERADTRSWHLLPGAVELVRIPVPAGTHQLSLGGGGWLSRRVDLGPVHVRPGEMTFVSHRIWR